jgi:hypothetical protein
MMDRDEGRETDGSPSDEIVERVSESKRQLVKVLLGGMAAYSVPLMASFSMEGLRIGVAEAGVGVPFEPPGLFSANQRPPGRPFQPGNQPPGQPFASNQTPPGRPFNPPL